MGAHISKVRSVVLDEWDDDMVKAMENMGNEASNRLFEVNLPKDRKITPEATSYVLRYFIANF